MFRDLDCQIERRQRSHAVLSGGGDDVDLGAALLDLHTVLFRHSLNVILGGFHFKPGVEEHVLDGREAEIPARPLDEVDEDVAVRPARIGANGFGVLRQALGDDALNGLKLGRGSKVRVIRAVRVDAAFCDVFGLPSQGR